MIDLKDKYFPVLDYGFVSLVDSMGNDSSIERAARVSYGPGTRSVNKTEGLLRYLMRHAHWSPFEMCEFTFHICLPIFVMRQLVRHRTASLNEFSGRYSVMPIAMYHPEKSRFQEQSKQNKQGSGESLDGLTSKILDEQLNISKEESSKLYEFGLKSGLARELARIDLPLRTYTQLYWKIDLRNLFNFIKLRSDSHAQHEIRVYSDVLAGIISHIVPLSFQAFLDYQYNSVVFNQEEMRILKSTIAGEEPDYSSLSKREKIEFENKLSKDEVNINYFRKSLVNPKSFDYYQKIMEDLVPDVDKNS